MKGIIKICGKMLAVFLVILFVFQTLPLETAAKTLNAINSTEKTEVQEETTLLYEITDKREENVKVYKTNFGGYSAYISSVPLHYLDNGEWKDIDNSLSQNDDGTFSNAANGFEVNLPVALADNSGVSISKDNYSVSFALNDTKDNQNVKVENNKKSTENSINTADNIASETDTSSSVEYKDVMKNTDVKYVVSGNSVKENIIIDKKSSVKDCYTFTVNVNGLIAVLNEDKSISLFDENDETCFFIPAPVMFDSHNVISSNIEVDLTSNIDGTYTLTYTPDAEWLGSRDRKYPVTIDPDIFASDTSVITDACVTSEAPDETGNNSVLGIVSNGHDINNNGSAYYAETYIKINTELIDDIFEGMTVTEAQLVSLGGNHGTVFLKEISGRCNFETVTYNTKPNLSGRIIDYFSSVGETEGNTYIHFNITKYFTDILTDSKRNKGLAVVAQDSHSYAALIGNGTVGGTSVNGLGLLVNYVDIKGYDSRYNYHTQNVGTAGTVYINDFTREMFIKREDISVDGNIMPLSVSFMYNSALSNHIENSGKNYKKVYGKNWVCAYNRCVEINENDFAPEATLSYYTEDGTVIVFAASTETDENGNEVTVLVEENIDILGSSGYTARILDMPEDVSSDALLEYIEITRPDGNIERFDSLGRLITVSKTVNTSNGPVVQQIKVHYVSDMSQDNNFLGIDYIEDGVGRKCTFTYENGSCLSEMRYGGSKFKYTYSSNYVNGYSLTGVSKNSVPVASYSKSSKDGLMCVKAAQQYLVNYEFDDKNSSKVKKYQDSGKRQLENEFTTGIGEKFEENGPYQRTITTVGAYPSKYQIEQFDKYGRLTGTVDNKGNYTYNSYDDNSGVASGNTGTISNLLANGGFENGLDGWQGTDITSSAVTSEVSESNAKSLRIQSDTSANKKVSQTVSVNGADTYTLSAMIKTDDTDTSHMLTLRIIAGNSVTEEQIENTRSVAAVGNDFSRYTVQINPLYETDLSNFNYITVEIGLENSAGDFYVDSVQLENGHGTGRYDYLTNGRFDNMQDDSNGWDISSDYYYKNDYVFSSDLKKSIIGFKTNGAERSNSVSQNVTVSGKKGDILTFGGWVNAAIVYNGSDTVLKKYLEENNYNNYETDRIAGLKIEYRYTEEVDGVLVPKTESVVKQINSFVSDWQYVANSVELKGDCKNVKVSFVYQNHPYYVYLADFSLTKAIAQNVSDEAENTAENSAQELSADTYSADAVMFNSENETYCVCGDNCAYGAGCTCTCASEQACNCIQCRKKFVIEYDEFGNITNIIINGYDLSRLLSMLSSSTYTQNGNYLASVTNENGKTTRYDYNQTSGKLNYVTDVLNTVTAFTYTNLGKISKVSAGKKSLYSDATMETEYEYNNFGQITKITHNDFSYYISYNQWGNVEKITVGLTGSIDKTRALATYTYYSGALRNLVKEAKFANGSGISYNYDDDGNLVKIVNRKDSTDTTNSNSSSYRYYYNSAGKLLCECDSNNSELSRVTYYNDNSVEIYSNGGLDYYAVYDDDGNLVEQINGTKYTAKTYESDIDEEENTIVSKQAVTNGKQTVGSLKTTDSFGRLSQNKLISRLPDDTDTAKPYTAVISDYTYKTYDSGTDTSATSRIDTLKNKVLYGTDSSNSVVSDYSFQYEYDDANNITYEYGVSLDGEKTLRYHYVYDRMNQLVRADDNVSHKSYVYTYDVGGNRTATKIYDFTLETLEGEPTVITQTYGFDLDSNVMRWNDRLKTYNGRQIIYDLEGNPVSYGGKTLNWYGKQLKQMTAADGSYTQYDYDANGLRTQKRQYKADGTTDYTVDYVWSDGKIAVQSLTYPLTMTIQGNTVTRDIKIDSKFIYCDDDATPSAIMLENDEYLLVRNLQGDVVAVVNAANGETVVEFSYDPWGNVTRKYSETYTDGATEEELKLLDLVMSALCPVTYRGYNYDFTTGLYYLQSRYYNPEWGRFLNTDDTSIMLTKTDDAFSANMYLYCNNNPVNNTDAFGRNPDKLIKDLVSLITIYMIIDKHNVYTDDPYRNGSYKSYLYEGIKDKVKNQEISLMLSESTCLYKYNIDLTKDSLFRDIMFCLTLNEELTYLCLTVLLMERFENSSNRKFLFSDECVKNEIKIHLKVYISSLIYFDAVDNNAISPTFSDYLLYSKLKKHAKVITIYEGDVYTKEQAKAFSYNAGINNCYKYTPADPYMNNGKREKSASVPKKRTAWQQQLMRYGKV